MMPLCNALSQGTAIAAKRLRSCLQGLALTAIGYRGTPCGIDTGS